MRRRRKQRILLFSFVILLVVIANAVAVTFALFGQGYDSYDSAILVFGSVDAGAKIKRSADSTYSSYVPLEPSDLISGNNLTYNLQLTVSKDSDVYVRIKADFQIKLKGWDEFKTFLDERNENYVSFSVTDAKYAKKTDGYYCTNSVYSASSTNVVNLTFNVSDEFGSRLPTGESLKDSICRIIVNVESVQGENGLQAWKY